MANVDETITNLVNTIPVPCKYCSFIFIQKPIRMTQASLKAEKGPESRNEAYHARN